MQTLSQAQGRTSGAVNPKALLWSIARFLSKSSAFDKQLNVTYCLPQPFLDSFLFHDFPKLIQGQTHCDDRDQPNNAPSRQNRAPIKAWYHERTASVDRITHRVKHRHRLHPVRQEAYRKQRRAQEQQRKRQNTTDGKNCLGASRLHTQRQRYTRPS